MEQVNPYEVSEAVVAPGRSVQVGADQHGVVVTPSALAAIVRAKNWVRLVGVVMILHMVISLVDTLRNMGLFGGSALWRSVGPAYVIGMIIGVGILCLFGILAVRLLQYAGHIKRLAESHDPADLERAIEAQTKFWLMSGIMLVMFVALMVVIFLFGILSTF